MPPAEGRPMDAVYTVQQTGDATRGSRCLVQGHRITIEVWSSASRMGYSFTAIKGDLDAAAILRNGRTAIVGRDVQEMDTRRGISEWTLIAEARICEVPLSALAYIFKDRLPAHLRPAL